MQNKFSPIRGGNNVEQLDTWLKTCRNDKYISPVSWDEFPKDLKLKLDNFARDEAVQRADEFARDNMIDLTRQDAIRQLVDAMAQTWALDGERVRYIVEDYIDTLPSEPGREFEKLSTKYFRRQATAIWADIVSMAQIDGEVDVIRKILPMVDAESEMSYDKNSFLQLLKSTYESWTIKYPKDAVTEILSLELFVDRQKEVAELKKMLEIIRLRGGKTWSRALELEMEVGVVKASKEDLVRILKRYALIIARDVPEIEKNTIGNSIEVEQEQPTETEVPEMKEAVAEKDVEDRAEDEQGDKRADHVVDEAIEEEVIAGTNDAGFVDESTEAAEDMEEPKAEVDEDKESMGDLSSADREAIDKLFSEEPEVKEKNDVKAIVSSEEKPSAAEEDDKEETVKKAKEPTVREERSTEAIATEESIFADEKVQKKVKKGLKAKKKGQLKKSKPVEQDKAIKEEAADSVMEKTPPSDEDLFVESGTELDSSLKADTDDRFAVLRTGPFRAKLVKNMYQGNEVLMDVFLAKLSGAPDWNRGKQFIANELFRCKLDLQSDLGKELFLTLRKCIGE